jgi:hypothetical protein
MRIPSKEILYLSSFHKRKGLSFLDKKTLRMIWLLGLIVSGIGYTAFGPVAA